MVSWADLHTYVFIILFCLVIFLYGLTNVLSVSFMTIIALEKLFDWGGEQLAMYCGPDLGDLIIVTLNKCVRLISASLDRFSDRGLIYSSVEATLAIILLIRCEYVLTCFVLARVIGCC
jgi:Ca2+:H+ antiporter